MNRAALYRTLRARLPNSIGIAIRDPRLPQGITYDEEMAAVACAIPRRRTEFAAGRDAARAAMSQIGLSPGPILMAQNRAPIWPEGVIGSITHCETCCVAVVTRIGDLSGIGVDIEEGEGLEPDLWEEICRPEELDWLQAQPSRQRGQLARQIFSAKEAVYKAINPLTGEVMEFQNVAVNTERSTSTLIRNGRKSRGPGVWQRTIEKRIISISMYP